MKFDNLEKMMREFETFSDRCVPSGIYMAARLDGRGFTRLTRQRYTFDAPYDVRFRDFMVSTARHLMDCGFKVLYAHTHSDEISLLLDPADQAFRRMTRKHHSILAGEASAAFSLLLGGLASFDCRVSELPSPELVADYFRWRSVEARRNALHSHCYWTLRSEGTGYRAAEAMLQGMPFEEKMKLLSRRGIEFDRLPAWQKNGVGLYWQTYEKTGLIPFSRPDSSKGTTFMISPSFTRRRPARKHLRRCCSPDRSWEKNNTARLRVSRSLEGRQAFPPFTSSFLHRIFF